VKFIDEARISVKAGDGGRGCVSFRREKYIPRGGPDGGDGGKGGDVILRSTSRKRTLSQFQFKRSFAAPNGGYGQGKQRTGRNGADLIIEVPPGTLIRNAHDNTLIKDLVADGDSVVVAAGGMGGKGNKHFTSATHRAPRFAQPGMPGESRELVIELKLLADVGIVGFPNAGKSTLISRMSSARPKIDSYPFTTISPVLGMVYPPGGEPFVMADIPGLIEGAHEGAGLGIRFLRHIERTRVLLHLIDASLIDPNDPLYAFNAIDCELAGYHSALAEKPCIVVLNKIDLPEAAAKAEIFAAAFGHQPVHRISAKNGTGITELLADLNHLLGMEGPGGKHE
jgi:GTPase